MGKNFTQSSTRFQRIAKIFMDDSVQTYKMNLVKENVMLVKEGRMYNF